MARRHLPPLPLAPQEGGQVNFIHGFISVFNSTELGALAAILFLVCGAALLYVAIFSAAYEKWGAPR